MFLVFFVVFNLYLRIDCCGDVADQSELFGDCIGCTRKCSCTKLKSCLCCVVGGKNGLARSSDVVGVGIV